ncbi:3-hydroxyacyl-CoA dehydrogenase family protein [Sabulicella rubraurantiaca]|uniref:3-hydroxyacyl-CoA dehydrogenase family protein n=1 Tax=Sabulicella rubraurantiaca TaxID=2811429 RepID=UPI001A95CB7B|nr:3-hydroxyacyl-CoA dehydrogenase family protein [Sabulicella rubraurantiaca]
MRVAVIGAGLMGHAIALVWAMGGHTVRLTDSSAETLERAQGLMEKAIATLTEHGENKGFDAAMLAQTVTRHSTLEETVEGVELVIEAIVENPEAKRTLYAELEKLAPLNATLASNTSYLDVFPLMPPSLLKRAMIAHWYTPPYLVDLVDLVPSEELEPGRLEAVQVALDAMGQVPVVMKRFIPGYIANRIQAAVQNEVQWLIDNGYADAQMVDAAVVHGIALRMPIVGVMAKADFTGLPLLQHTFRNKMYTPPASFESSPSMDALIAKGATGVMSGRGYYDWGDEPAKLFEERDRKLIALKKSLREIGTMAGFRK